MMNNFRQPYLATSITDFWRRWHISLSTWFRDYLYIPLGGNKRSKLRTNINLLTVMTIAGLWHGAAFGFIVWGLLHGIFLILDKYLAIQRLKNEKFAVLFHALSWSFTQSAVFVAWIFFRNPDLSDALGILNSIVSRTPGIFEISDAFLVCGVFFLSFSLDFAEKMYKNMKNRSDLLVGMSIGVLLLMSAILKSSEVVPFIYFRF